MPPDMELNLRFRTGRTGQKSSCKSTGEILSGWKSQAYQRFVALGVNGSASCIIIIRLTIDADFTWRLAQGDIHHHVFLSTALTGFTTFTVVSENPYSHRFPSIHHGRLTLVFG